MTEEAAVTLRQEHPRHFACASIVFGRHLMEVESDPPRKERKRRILERRMELLRESSPAAADVSLYDVKAPNGFDGEQAAAMIVDLAFCAPFAPYHVEVSETDFEKALQTTGADMDYGKAHVGHVLGLKKEALAAHAPGFWSSPAKIVAVGALAAATVAVPFLPAAIGAAGGLAGAAAAAHGLALLAGGSLAAGGLGMAGGVWVLGTLQAAAVVATAAAPRVIDLVRSAPTDALRLEVAKAQATTVLRVEGGLWSRQDALECVRFLDSLRRDLETDLNEEREHNDPGSARITALAEKIKAIDIARTWITARVV